MSPTRRVEPSGLARTTISRIAVLRSATPIVRTLMLPTPVRTDPPGRSVIQRRIASLILGKLRRYFSSVSSETSMRIS